MGKKKIIIFIGLNIMMMLSLFFAGCIQKASEQNQTSETSETETPVKTIYLYPNAAGSYTNFIPSGASSNFDCVNEQTVNYDQDYVYMGNVDDRIDFYNFQDITDQSIDTLISSIIVNIIISTKGSNPNFEAEYYISFWTPAKNYHYSVGEYKPSDGWVKKNQVFFVNPITNQRWTINDINNLQAGFRVSNRQGGGPDNTYCCTQEFITINLA
jgi:hypothetical protein